MHDVNPLLLTDGYKLGHRIQYPPNTTMVYSNWTPRGSRLPNIDKVVVLGMQYFVKRYLMDMFNRGFFNRPKIEVVSEYKAYYEKYLGTPCPTEHIEALHDLGFLPLIIKSLPEGVSCPLRVPMLTVHNTRDDFFWLTNYIETLMSSVLWQFSTSATIAKRFRDTMKRYLEDTDPESMWFLDWQCHDFSMRGMSGVDSGLSSGAGHAASFHGSDTFPVMWFLSKYYKADIRTEDLVIGSVPATEHSVMCAGGQDSESETFQRLMDTYPAGVLSVVSDTWDLWKVLTEILPENKPQIMRRDGKLVIRPDSGDPVKIVCGDPNAEPGTPEFKGVVELLWDEFGGELTSKGFKRLDSHVGCIYGDSITLDRAERICQGLAAKGFASSNVVLGVGSFTYQFNTRDVFMFAMKATAAIVDGKLHELEKDPVTDNGIKKSLCGFLRVVREDGELVCYDHQHSSQINSGELRTIFCDGKLIVNDNWATIRARIANDE